MYIDNKVKWLRICCSFGVYMLLKDIHDGWITLAS